MDQIRKTFTYCEAGQLAQEGIPMQGDSSAQVCQEVSTKKPEAMSIQKMPNEIKCKFVQYLPEKERARTITLLRISPFLVASALAQKDKDALLNDPLIRIGIKNEVEAVLSESDFVAPEMESFALWSSQRVAYLPAGGSAQKKLLDVLFSYLHDASDQSNWNTQFGSTLMGSNNVRSYPRNTMLVLDRLHLALCKQDVLSEHDQGRVLRNILSYSQHLRRLPSHLLRASDRHHYQKFAYSMADALIDGVISPANQEYAQEIMVLMSATGTNDLRAGIIGKILAAKRTGKLATASKLCVYQIMAKLCMTGAASELHFPVAQVLARSICLTDEAQPQMILLQYLQQLLDGIGDEALGRIAQSLVYAVECDDICRGNYTQTLQLLRACLPGIVDQMAGAVLGALVQLLHKTPSNDHGEVLCLMIDIARTKTPSQAGIENAVDSMAEVLCWRRLKPLHQELALQFISLNLTQVSLEACAEMIDKLKNALTRQSIHLQNIPLVEQIIDRVG